jgi:hypothetical protein
MSPEERDQWWAKIMDSEDWSDRDSATDALLDRVEHLERELAAARTEPRRTLATCPMCGSEDTHQNTPDSRRCRTCDHRWGGNG